MTGAIDNIYKISKEVERTFIEANVLEQYLIKINYIYIYSFSQLKL